MTSAARPTFLPALGGHSLKDTAAGPVSYKSAKELPSHTKLKFRLDGQSNIAEMSQKDLKAILLLKEKEYTEKLKSIPFLISATVTKEIKLDSTIATLDADDSDHSLSSDGSNDSDDSENDDDDTAALLLELEKIKKERQEEKERLEKEQAEIEARRKEELAMSGNPLLSASAVQEGTSFVKRRWDDDVIFKNQARGVTDNPKKRFINDMLRSDFHRKFMDKYVK
jgi:protein CWC15